MNKPLLLALGACALVLTLPTSVLAKGAGKAAGAGGGKGERKQLKGIFAKYDKNSNGVLDPDEREAIRTDFATDTTLKILDKNSDGKLDDAELDVLKAGKKGAGKGKGKNK